MRISVRNSICIIFLLIPITTIIQGLPFFDSVNKLIYGCLMILLGYELVQRMSRRGFVLISFVALSYIIALIETANGVAYVNDLFYFLLLVLICVYFSKNVDGVLEILLQKYYKLTRITINIWSVMIVLTAVIPSCYKVEYGTGGNYRTFTSFSESGFRVATAALLDLTILILCMRKERNKSDILHIAVALFCGVACGSRTYLVLIGVLTIIALFFYSKNKKQFITFVAIGIVMMIIVIGKSSMIDKIKSASYNKNSYMDFWGTLSSGRSVFWEADLNAMKSQPLFNKIFGKGFNYVYQVNLVAVGRAIYAHNDFINLYLNFGMLGVVEYIYACHMLFSRISKNRKIPFVLKSLVWFVWIFNAMINMFYTYICAIVSFVLLIAVVSDKYSEENI